MKKSILVSMTFVSLSTCCVTATLAQTHAKTPGNKMTVNTAVSNRVAQTSSRSNRFERGFDKGAPERKCTPLKRDNPYAIKRSDFEKLPADRKRFIMDNPSKYTIIQ